MTSSKTTVISIDINVMVACLVLLILSGEFFTFPYVLIDDMVHSCLICILSVVKYDSLLQYHNKCKISISCIGSVISLVSNPDQASILYFSETILTTGEKNCFFFKEILRVLNLE